MALDDQFLSILKTLKLPFLNKETVATLRTLEDQWLHWRNCESQYADANIPADHDAAYTAFLDNPDDANQRALLATADRHLVAARYALLRRAYADLRCKVSTEAGKVLRPFLERINTAMSEEHAKRLEHAAPVNYSKLLNPAVIEAQKASNYANSIYNRVFAASNELGRDDSPLELARPILDVSRSQKD
jgi:hypothetical protein